MRGRQRVEGRHGSLVHPACCLDPVAAQRSPRCCPSSPPPALPGAAALHLQPVRRQQRLRGQPARLEPRLGVCALLRLHCRCVRTLGSAASWASGLPGILARWCGLHARLPAAAPGHPTTQPPTYRHNPPTHLSLSPASCIYLSTHAVHKLRDNLKIFHELRDVFPPRELRSSYLVQARLHSLGGRQGGWAGRASWRSLVPSSASGAVQRRRQHPPHDAQLRVPARLQEILDKIVEKNNN